MTLSPNPASNYIDLESSTEGIVELYNACGNLISTNKMDNKFLHLNLEGMNTGFYFILLKTTKGMLFRKVIIE
jgi:hypothetical protein